MDTYLGVSLFPGNSLQHETKRTIFVRHFQNNYEPGLMLYLELKVKDQLHLAPLLFLGSEGNSNVNFHIWTTKMLENCKYLSKLS